ncbi:MAG TPA: exodeoxyribonuclease V subunit gamma [Buchnera sp. (in: enterobacteria)]|nr:exodeoxyribonuclease V subunit gamma [Buchnera sp. (in: enterobacteria)]
MFLIYQASRFDILLDQVCKVIAEKPLPNPLQSEIFLVKNIETSHWIKLYIAKKLKISANIKFFTPKKFILKLFKTTISKKSNNIILNQSIITWTIMILLERETINDLININDSLHKKFIFASEMAKLFSQYLFYRPNEIYLWRNNVNYFGMSQLEIWQKKLWKKIVEYHNKNNDVLDYSYLFTRFIKNIKNKNIKLSFFPYRIFICEILDIPISFLSVLYSISDKYQINLLLITPYLIHINYIQSLYKKNINNNSLHISINQTNIKTKQYDLYHQLNNIHLMNEIVLSCGQYGFEYTFFLSLIKNKYIHCPIIKYKKNLLQIVQNNIIKNLNNSNKIILYKNDQSISIHICHNMKKEIEILHNNLLNMFNKNPDLFPRNILVKIVKLHLYIPFIEAIFTEKSHKNYMPFMIFNEFSNKKNEIFFNFKKILSIGDKRFYNKEIFSLITSSSLIKKFEINEKDIPMLFKIINESGIQWGIDFNHLNNLSLPNNVKHTWESGIQRMILGYAIKDTKKSWNNIIPYPIHGTSKMIIVGKLIKFITMLYKWKKKLSTAKSLTSWLPLCHELINDFFYINSENYEFIEEIKNKWKKIIYTGIEYQYKKKFLFQY